MRTQVRFILIFTTESYQHYGFRIYYIRHIPCTLRTCRTVKDNGHHKQDPRLVTGSRNPVIRFAH